MTETSRDADASVARIFRKTGRTGATRRGYSLAELILGAAVLAAFFVRVFQSYATTNEGDRYTKFINEMNIINGEALSLYTASLSFNGFDQGQLTGTLPRGYIDNSTNPPTINTAYNTAMTFMPVKTAQGAYGGLEMTFGMPPGDCVRFTAGPSPVFDYASVNGSAALRVPISYPDAVNMCKGTTGDNTMVITITGGQPL